MHILHAFYLSQERRFVNKLPVIFAAYDVDIMNSCKLNMNLVRVNRYTSHLQYHNEYFLRNSENIYSSL